MFFEDCGSSWIGVKSVEQAKDMLMNGYEKPLEDLKVKIDKELKNIRMWKKAKNV